MPMTHASLFSGIGGFELAAEWMGWSNLFNCEWEEFPRRVLKYHFPKTKQYGDIKELDATAYAGRVDILTGGFPCQPYSVAGKRKGKEDDRHLWPEMLRVIRECTPRYVVGENVRGLVGWNGGLVFEEVCSDLETEGYAVQPFVLPACAVNAPHRRDRVWFVASHTQSESGGRQLLQGQGEGQSRRRHFTDATDTKSSGCRGRSGEERQERREGLVQGKCQGREVGSEATGRGGIGFVTDTHNGRKGHQVCTGRDEFTSQTWDQFPTVSPVCGGDDGLSKELDGLTFSKWRRESIKAYGNAIVPQVALQIFKAIAAIETGE